MGPVTNHLAQVEGGKIFASSLPKGQQIQPVGSLGGSNDQGGEDRAVVIGGREFSEGNSVHPRENPAAKRTTAPNRGGMRRGGDDGRPARFPSTGRPGTISDVTAPMSDPSRPVSDGGLVEGPSETMEFQIMGLGLPWEVALLLLVLSTLTLVCC